MPWIFLCLMLANTAYLGWAFATSSGGASPASGTGQFEQQGASVALLSERPAPAPSPAPADTGLKETAQVEQVVAEVRCLNVGPFQSELAAHKFARSLRSQGHSVRLEKRRMNERDYWVFIPAFTNRQKAEEKLRDLRAKGIEGFVVREGVFVNSVSLNHFSQRDLAQAFLEKMQAEGVSAEYREIIKAGHAFWVYLSPKDATVDMRNEVDGYVSDREGLRKEMAACEE